VDTSTLSDLFDGVATVADAYAATAVWGISYRSDLTRQGDVFFCVPGFRR